MNHERREEEGNYDGDGKCHPVHSDTSHKNSSAPHFSCSTSELLRSNSEVHIHYKDFCTAITKIASITYAFGREYWVQRTIRSSHSRMAICRFVVPEQYWRCGRGCKLSRRSIS